MNAKIKPIQAAFEGGDSFQKLSPAEKKAATAALEEAGLAGYKRYLSTSEAAVILGVIPRRVRDFCIEGRIGARVGHTWIIERKELIKFMKKSREVGNPNFGKKKRASRANA